jgi:hypothetical protein
MKKAFATVAVICAATLAATCVQAASTKRVTGTSTNELNPQPLPPKVGVGSTKALNPQPLPPKQPKQSKSMRKKSN